MTCIIAYKDKNKLYMGADSAATYSTTSGSDTLIHTQIEPLKIFKKDGFLFSTSHSLRFGQVLRDNFTLPPLTDSENIATYLTTKFIPKLIETLDQHKLLEMKDGEARGYTFIIGVRGRLFQVNSDFAIMEIDELFLALGAGEQYAFGALAAFENSPYDDVPYWTRRAKILRALSISAKYCPSVREPFIIIESDTDAT